MSSRLQRKPALRHDAPGFNDPPVSCRCRGRFKETPMIWQTPTATDFRFGFEITLYISAR
jgi:coenzyme PQQ precursor peptide PqqA